MPQIPENFTELTDFDPILTDIFFMQYKEIMQQRQAVFAMRTSTKSKETDDRIGSFSDPKEFKGRVEFQTVRNDFEIVYTHTAFADGFQVERELLDDMQYEGIFTTASQMGTAFGRKQEKDAWGVFNNAFTAGASVGYDAKALCADDHPRSETDSTAVDNLSTAALTDSSLEDSILQLEGLGDDRGEEITTEVNLLVVPRALRKKAFQLTESELTPEDANNSANVHQGLQFMVVPRLTSTTAWFVLDTTMSKMFLKWYDRKPVEFAAEESFDTFMRRYRGYMRYSHGWSDFRWVVGSTGAG